MSLVLNVEILGEFKKLTQATRGAEGQLGKLNKTTKTISSSIRNTLGAIGVGFSLVAVTRGIKDSLEAASDLEQQFGALESIFKDLAPEMQEFSRSLAPIGLSASDAARSMALLGSQLKGYGVPVDEASEKTKELTQLAADLAATFGGTTYGAVESISSLFRGEFDPIEKYGVAIKKSDINARLAAEGLSHLEGEALKQAEAQAALTILFEKTADAQGQAARESETFASQQAYLRAESENLKAEIGEGLLPVMVELFREIRNNLPAIQEFLSKLVQIIPVIAELILKVIEYKEQILAVTITLGTLRVAFLGVNTAIGIYTALTTKATLSSVGLMAVFANPFFLGAALVIGGIALALSTLKTEANAARDAVSALNREQEKSASSGGYSFDRGNQSYAPYAYTTPTTTSRGIAGQPKATSSNTNINVNINRAKVDAQDIIRDINTTLKNQGSTRLLR
jgi:hypothetical protein